MALAKWMEQGGYFVMALQQSEWSKGVILSWPCSRVSGARELFCHGPLQQSEWQTNTVVKPLSLFFPQGVD